MNQAARAIDSDATLSFAFILRQPDIEASFVSSLFHANRSQFIPIIRVSRHSVASVVARPLLYSPVSNGLLTNSVETLMVEMQGVKPWSLRL